MINIDDNKQKEEEAIQLNFNKHVIEKMIANGDIPGIKSMEEFHKTYIKNRGPKFHAAAARFEHLREPIGADELRILKLFLDPENHAKAGQEYKIVSWKVKQIVDRASMKFLFQNREKFGLVLTEEELKSGA